MLLLFDFMIIWQHRVYPQLPIFVPLALVHPYKIVFLNTTTYSATSFANKFQNEKYILSEICSLTPKSKNITLQHY